MKPTDVIRILVSAWFNQIKKSLKLWWSNLVQKAELTKLHESLPHQNDPGAYERAMDIISDIDRIETRAAILRTEYIIREARRLGVETPRREVGEFYDQMSVNDVYPEA